MNTTLLNPATERQQLSRLEINLAQVEANWLALQKAVNTTSGKAGQRVKICSVLKKNAYGLGAGPIATRLAKLGSDMLAIYSPDEAEQLISQAVPTPLLLLIPLHRLGRTDPLYRYAVAGRLHLTVHDLGQLDAVNQIGRTFGIRMPVHLHLDTGMSRSGLPDRECQAILDRLRNTTHVQLAGLYTHFASADADPDFTQQQFERFQQAVASFDPAVREKAMLHIANTFGIIRNPAFHMDMIRPGLGLFGFGPQLLQGEPRLQNMPDLKPVMRWISRLIHVQQYPAGTPVGYGSTHILQRESTLGVVPVGYGDGYPLALSNRAIVRVRPNTTEENAPWCDAPLLGRVNMDQLVIDLTDVLANHAAAPETFTDAEVELFSDDPAAPNALPRLAELADSHCYELLCRLNPALPRVYQQRMT